LWGEALQLKRVSGTEVDSCFCAVNACCAQLYSAGADRITASVMPIGERRVFHAALAAMSIGPGRGLWLAFVESSGTAGVPLTSMSIRER
jgi:hypothetical protein